MGDAPNTYLAGDCDECGEEVTAADAIRHPSHSALFCSRKCRHKWDSNLHRRL